MNLCLQPTPETCGQACIAMIVSHSFSILTVHTNAGYTHWTLLFDGRYYDPEFGVIEGEYPHGKITSFLGIYK